MIKLKDKKRIKAIWYFDNWYAICPYCNFKNQGNINLLCLTNFCIHFYIANNQKNIVYFYKPKKKGN